MNIIEEKQNLVVTFGIVLEASASELTQGGSGGIIESAIGMTRIYR